MKAKSCVKSVSEMYSAYPINGVRRITRKLIKCGNCTEKFSSPASYATHTTERCFPSNGVSMASSASAVLISSKSTNNMRAPTSGSRKNVTDKRTSIFRIPKKKTEKIQCNLCDMTFFYKTSLATHQRTHAAINTCQHCHRTFAISSALSKHLRENCSKIPIPAKKRLLEKDNRISQNAITPKVRRSRHELLLSYPVKSIGSSVRKLISCDNCHAKFANPASYATHFLCCISSRCGKIRKH